MPLWAGFGLENPRAFRAAECHNDAMGYPKNLLTEGESVQFELRPHWRSLIPGSAVAIVTIAIASYLWAKMPDFGLGDGQVSVLQWVVLIVALIIVVAALVKPVLRWLSTHYVFTNRRIIVRAGILRKVGRDMPLSKLNNVSFSQTLFERMFSCGQLIVESAAESGNLVINDVPNIEYIQREIYTLHERDAARSRAGYREPQAPAHTEVLERPAADTDLNAPTEIIEDPRDRG
jgi:uncharacterized membrane protein YdbT with pleckstrin-like domain